MSAADMSLPGDLVISLQLVPIRRVFDAREKDERSRWRDDKHQAWLKDATQQVSGSKEALADCNAWLERVSFDAKIAAMKPTTASVNDVKTYVEFLWLARKQDITHSCALDPVRQARKRWGCNRPDLFKTTDEIYAENRTDPLPNFKRKLAAVEFEPTTNDQDDKPALGPHEPPTSGIRAVKDVQKPSTSSSSRRSKINKRSRPSSTFVKSEEIQPDVSAIASSHPVVRKSKNNRSASRHAPSYSAASTTNLLAPVDKSSDGTTSTSVQSRGTTSLKFEEAGYTENAHHTVLSNACLPKSVGQTAASGSPLHQHHQLPAHTEPSAIPSSVRPSKATSEPESMKDDPTSDSVKKNSIVFGRDELKAAVDPAAAITPRLPPTQPTSTLGKPTLRSLGIRPPIWAKNRQEVCESTDYFRSYQGGVYFSNNQVYGYLLGGFPSKRDNFLHDGRLIISHGGGGNTVYTTNKQGKAKHGDSLEKNGQHSEDRSVSALLNNYRNKCPVALLADEDYALFPYNLKSDGYVYVVLGYYWITNVWAEYDGVRPNGEKIIRYKVAFQWCDGQGDPWWPPPSQKSTAPIVPSNPATALMHDGSTALTRTCTACGEASTKIYTVGWMCLAPACIAFWCIDGCLCTPDNLDPEPLFTALKPQPQEIGTKRMPLEPPQPSFGELKALATSRQASKGIHCLKCGRLSCRFRWSCYECSNSDCGVKIPVIAGIRRSRDFLTQNDSIESPFSIFDPNIVVEPRVVQGNGSSERLRVITYNLPFGRGQIHHIPHTPGSTKLTREVNTIFREYQEQAATGKMDFRRFPLRAHHCRGTLLTGYFSQNSGAPYNYVGGSLFTIPLGEGGASVVQDAMDLMKRRIGAVVEQEVPFNEVMSVAYMEDQRMGFHADAEKGLGPIVASLSLGSTAHMHFRRSKQGHDSTTGDVLKEARVLTVVLKHGDILVMQDAKVQQYYEHTVEPMGFRIVATARVISPENYS